jgi:ElaB/YqjD/DUF883 family membrane-anchored ribosome-binding protein
MNENNESMPQAVTTLVEEAEALLTATADMTEHAVVEARKRLSMALEKGRESWEAVQEKAIAGARATDEAIREYPYRALGAAFSIGALLGLLIRRRS